MLIAWTMRKSRYDEAESGELKRWRLVNTFSAIESAKKHGLFLPRDMETANRSQPAAKINALMFTVV